jgi:hypothetical protein
MWLKVYWENLKLDDQENQIGSYSWIPRWEFPRFWGGSRLSMLRIRELWDEQEKRHQKHLESSGQIAKGHPLAPFPLD